MTIHAAALTAFTAIACAVRPLTSQAVPNNAPYRNAQLPIDARQPDRSYSGVLIDIDRDGDLDLVVSHDGPDAEVVHLNDGKGGFSARRPFGPSTATIRGAESVDLNRDGITDIVAIDQRSGPAIFWGRADGTYADAVSLGDVDATPYALAVADVDRNGRPGVIVGYVESRPVIYFNDGPEGFLPSPFGDAEGAAYGFAVADLDGDGLLDIGMARSDARNMLYFGAAAGGGRSPR